MRKIYASKHKRGLGALKSTFYIHQLLQALSGLNPRYAPAHYWYSQYLGWIEKDYNGAIEEARYAIDLEPVVSHWHHLLAFV